MRTVLSLLGVVAVLWQPPAPVFPPELPPLVPLEHALFAAGFVGFAEDVVPAPPPDVIITVDVFLALAVGVDPARCPGGEALTNQTLVNSLVPNVVHRVVGCYQTTYVSSGNMQTDWAFFVNKTDGVLDDVHVRRNAIGADLAGFITKSMSSCGLGWAPATATNYEFMVAEECAEKNFSYPHEWGHNLGLAHDQPNTTNAWRPYSHGWCLPTSKDVMVYHSPCTSPRVARYSNPQLLVNGVPAGDFTVADGARVIRERAATTAAFKTLTLQRPQRPVGGRVQPT